MNTPLRMCWGPADVQTATAPVLGLNISEGGAAFVSEHPLPLAVTVRLELPNGGASASATVRNCSRWGAAWRVGVEFCARFARAAPAGEFG